MRCPQNQPARPMLAPLWSGATTGAHAATPCLVSKSVAA
jgi:hypothetical protein